MRRLQNFTKTFYRPPPFSVVYILESDRNLLVNSQCCAR